MKKQARYLKSVKYDVYCNYNQDSESMEQFKADFGLPSGVTGIIASMGDGEIEEIWYTEDNIPWALDTYYTKADKR